MRYRLYFLKDVILARPLRAGKAETRICQVGRWYDNVPAEDAEGAIASGAAVAVTEASCRCLLAGNRVVRRAIVRGGFPCPEHGG